MHACMHDEKDLLLRDHVMCLSSVSAICWSQGGQEMDHSKVLRKEIGGIGGEYHLHYKIRPSYLFHLLATFVCNSILTPSKAFRPIVPSKHEFPSRSSSQEIAETRTELCVS